MRKTITRLLSSAWFLPVCLLVIVSAITYLPWIGRFSYFNDDWYLMYAARVGGPSAFLSVFSEDRPARALVMIPVYRLFGDNILYYNISAYIVRLMSGLGIYWLFSQLWPKERTAGALMALLFLIYPGFLNQPNAIDYQCHLIALAAATFSLALTVKAVTASRKNTRAAWTIGAILLGWFYLWQMEYYIGFEAIRVLLLVVVLFREQGSWLQKTWKVLVRWLPFLMIPLVFLTWKVFFFESARSATDIGSQLSVLTSSHLGTGSRYLVNWFQSTVSVVLTAWGMPYFQLITGQEQQFVNLGLGIAAIGTGITVLLKHWLESNSNTNEKTNIGSAQQSDWRKEAFLLGMAAAAAGLLPIILVNRQVSFPGYSRYTLISSTGAVMVLVAILYSLSVKWLRTTLAAFFVLIAILTHGANSTYYLKTASIVNSFWWQVSWRIPQLEQGTTIVANNPDGRIKEDYHVWGPANMIYYPEGVKEGYIQGGIYAALLNRDTTLNILTKQGQEFSNRRSVLTYRNYRNVLVISKPTPNSCVHVMDSSLPGYSSFESDSIMTIAPYSEIDRVLVEQGGRRPPENIFGAEPEHDWCYYYEKASLAHQRENWNEVLGLGEEAARNGYFPLDTIEWMPFIHASMQTGNMDTLTDIAEKTANDDYVNSQVCKMTRQNPADDPAMMEKVELLFCTVQ
ncbi:MAG: hypothetical protein JXA13_15510 [Anaerolineales bacterium]|nr:hypothetical protein [Anaerolineales bacterium]